MQRVERHIIIKSEIIDDLCFKSKNLYNLANYHIRQEFINNGNWVRYNALDKLLQQTDAYKALPSATSQQILRLLDKNWASFFRAIKDYGKHPEKYLGRPKLPKYKHKVDGRNIVIFTNQQVKLKNGKIYFPKMTGLKPLETKVNNICQVRIVPNATCYIIEVVYKKEVKNVLLDNNAYLGLDIGINNFATCINNIGLNPFVVNGKIIKSINQFYNKKKAQLQSFIGDEGTSKRINHLTHRRNNKINDYLHKTSRTVIDYCIKHGIKTIVVGKNKNWKQEINIGSRNNQNFVSIPFARLINQLKYKGEEVGIIVTETEESYTSKCSFLDSEKIGKSEKYLGKRVKRGLFKSSLGKLINADVNGAYNILKKVIPNVFDNFVKDNGIVRCGLHPVIINVNDCK